MQPCFSLILPVYNVEAYLDRCMRSILEQDFQDYEIILVDDGSPDRCGEICDGYARKYSHVHVIHKPNGGLSSARNAGLQAAKGEYIWFIDSDDWIEPGALSLLREVCDAHRPDAVKFNHSRVSGGNREEVRCNVPAGVHEGEAQMNALIERAFCAGGKFVLSAWSYVYRRALLEENRCAFVSEREVGSEDYLFNLSLMPRIRKLLMLDAALYNYDKREGSLTQRYREELVRQYSCLYRHILDAYQAMDLRGKYESLIHRFYVWHMVMGTCLPHEYCRIAENHSLADGRKNVRRMLSSRELRRAVKYSSKAGLPLKKRMQLWAMAWRFEPLFYYLYVIKPGRKAGK